MTSQAQRAACKRYHLKNLEKIRAQQAEYARKRRQSSVKTEKIDGTPTPIDGEKTRKRLQALLSEMLYVPAY